MRMPFFPCAGPFRISVGDDVARVHLTIKSFIAVSVILLLLTVDDYYSETMYICRP